MSDYTKDVRMDVILTGLKVANLKQVYRYVSDKISDSISCPPSVLLNHLMEREKKSSSGVGDGVAIPHLRMDCIDKPLKILVILKNQINIGSDDNQPVDLISMVLSPKNESHLHLLRLSRISRLLRNKVIREKIREASDEAFIRSLLIEPEDLKLAA